MFYIIIFVDKKKLNKQQYIKLHITVQSMTQCNNRAHPVFALSTLEISIFCFQFNFMLIFAELKIVEFHDLWYLLVILCADCQVIYFYINEIQRFHIIKIAYSSLNTHIWSDGRVPLKRCNLITFHEMLRRFWLFFSLLFNTLESSAGLITFGAIN